MEGNSKAIITFTNPDTKEYTFYELNAKTIMSEVLETFTVEAPVRQTARAIITVENPLFAENIPVNMGSLSKPVEWWSCDSKYMRVNELTPLSGNREGTFEVEYRPLMITQNNSGNMTEHLVTIITQELGTFKYKVCARATPPLLKQILRFSAPLGGMQTEAFLFRAYNTTKVDYQCVVDKPDIFSTQKICTVEPVSQPWNGDEVRLNIQYEPTEIGEVEDTLTISSNEYGTYQCQLMGSCTPPMPQGPVFLEQGGSTVEIPFRNCFTTQTAWSLSVDCSAFRIVQPATLTNIMINAKTESKVGIVFDPNEEQIATALASESIITAKLFITCTSKPGVPSWVYYLKGKVLFDKPSAPANAKGAKKK
jgi:hydrocephalus-inducing protein